MDCIICTDLKKTYPEYEVFGSLRSETTMLEDGSRFEKRNLYKYDCNLCGSSFDYVCEFDFHMRNHTKYGKNIAIIGMISKLVSSILIVSVMTCLPCLKQN